LPRRIVSTPREDRLAVGAERHRHHRARMQQGRVDWLARGDVPEPHRPADPPGESGFQEQVRTVCPPDEDGTAIRTERQRVDRARMRQGRADGLARGDVPELRQVALRASREDGPTVGTERYRRYARARM